MMVCLHSGWDTKILCCCRRFTGMVSNNLNYTETSKKNQVLLTYYSYWQHEWAISCEIRVHRDKLQAGQLANLNGNSATTWILWQVKVFWWHQMEECDVSTECSCPRQTYCTWTYPRGWHIRKNSAVDRPSYSRCPVRLNMTRNTVSVRALCHQQAVITSSQRLTQIRQFRHLRWKARVPKVRCPKNQEIYGCAVYECCMSLMKNEKYATWHWHLTKSGWLAQKLDMKISVVKNWIPRLVKGWQCFVHQNTSCGNIPVSSFCAIWDHQYYKVSPSGYFGLLC